MLFTDESRFCVNFLIGQYVWRAKGERVDVTNVQQGGGGLVKAWRGIHKNGRTKLVIERGTLPTLEYCERIVVPYVVPFFQNHDAINFHQDNACPHSANYTRQVLAKKHNETVNGHRDLPIYRLLNTCRTFLDDAFTPEMTSTTFQQQIDQQYEETLYHCDKQNGYHTQYRGLCDF